MVKVVMHFLLFGQIHHFGEMVNDSLSFALRVYPQMR
jgi:hypothetical protein